PTRTSIQIDGTAYTGPFADLMPPPAADELADLEADIRAHGITVPVVVTDAHEVLDGHCCLRIAARLGLTEIPLKVGAGLTPERKREIAESLNLHRRHLSREQRQEIIARRLKANPA